jgi:hypothetical protein
MVMTKYVQNHSILLSDTFQYYRLSYVRVSSLYITQFLIPIMRNKQFMHLLKSLYTK